MARLCIPHTESAVVAAGGEPGAIGAEDHAIDFTLVPAQAVNQPTALNVPDQCSLANRCEQTPVGTVGEVINHGLTAQRQQFGVMQAIEKVPFPLPILLGALLEQLQRLRWVIGQ